MLLETTIDPRPDSAVRVRWQPGTGKAKMVPTFDALRIELAWTGWRDVTVFTDYRPDSNEVLLLCRKTDELAGGRGRRRGRPAPARPGRAGVSSATPPAAHARRDRPRGGRGLGDARTADRGADRLRRRAHPLGRLALARRRRRTRGPRRRLRLRPAATRCCSPRCTCSRPTTSTPTGGRGISNALALRARSDPRVLPRAPAASSPAGASACAAFAVALPSALYTGFVMTEGAAYAACVLALLALARCLERPTVTTQLLALAASASRPPLGSSSRRSRPRWSLALVVRALLTAPRCRTVDDLAGVWPLLVVARRSARSRSASGPRSATRSRATATSGARTTSSRSRAGRGARSPAWASTSRSCPLVVAPAVARRRSRGRARAGEREAAAFVSLFLGVNAVLLARRRRVLEHGVRRRLPPRPLPLLRRAAVDRLDGGVGRAAPAARRGRARRRRVARARATRDAADVPPERRRRAPLRRVASALPSEVGGRAPASREPHALVARRRRRSPRSALVVGLGRGCRVGSCSSPSPPCSR